MGPISRSIKRLERNCGGDLDGAFAMSQGDMIAWLRAHPGWHTWREMAESMGFAKRGAGKSLSVLVDIGEVERREVKVERGGRMYEYSIGKE